MKLRNKVDESHKTILNIRDVRKQLSEFAAKIEKTISLLLFQIEITD